MSVEVIVLEPKDPDDAERKSTSLRLPVKLHAEIKDLADRLGYDMSDVAIYLLRRGLELERAEQAGELDLFKAISGIRSLAAKALRLLSGRRTDA